jgi:hypothetical protein
MKGQRVGALGKFHDDRPRALGRVVVGELRAQTPSLNSDEGIEMRVEVGRAPEYLSRDLIFLQR